jgi:hypothetical protein
MIDGILAVAVLLGLVLNAGLGWWWADPVTGYMLVYYAAREVPTPVMTNTPNDWNGSAWTTPANSIPQPSTSPKSTPRCHRWPQS